MTSCELLRRCFGKADRNMVVAVKRLLPNVSELWEHSIQPRWKNCPRPTLRDHAVEGFIFEQKSSVFPKVKGDLWLTSGPNCDFKAQRGRNVLSI